MLYSFSHSNGTNVWSGSWTPINPKFESHKEGLWTIQSEQRLHFHKCYKCHCLFQFVDPHKHKQLHCLTYKLHFLPQLPRVLTSHDWYSPCRPLGRQPVLAEIWGAYFSIVLFVVHANYRVHKVGKSGLIKMSWYYWQDKDTVWKDQVKTRSSLKVVFFFYQISVYS